MSNDIDLAALGATDVYDLNGRPISLGRSWAEQTVVLVFLRHYG